MVLTAILQNKFNYSYLTNDQTVTKVDKITYCMSALLQSPCIFHSLKKKISVVLFKYEEVFIHT